MNYVGLILLVASIFIFGLQGMASEMGIAVAASFVFLAFANLDKFSKFKGAGFEAEMKHVVDEANATIVNLKEVAKPLIQTNLILMAKAGRFSEGGFNKSHVLYDQLMTLQKDIGLQSDDLEKSKSQYLNVHAWDMIIELAGNVERAGNKGFSVTSNEAMGRRRYDALPDLNKFIGLLSSIELDETSSKQLSIIKEYYSKYEL